MKEVLIKGSIFCISMVLGLLLCEGIIRLTAPQRLDFVRPLYDPDDDLVFKLRKNFRAVHSQFEFNVVETTNSLGLRDHEIEPKKPGTLRILGLGDSYGYGHGVTLEETYVKRLESSLNASADRPVEVINAGVPAYSLVQEVRYLKKYGLALEPDVVLLGFYVGNDFVDSYELFDAAGAPTIAVSGHLLVSRKARDAERGMRGWTQSARWYLAMHSHLYTFLRNRLSGVLIRLGWRHVAHAPEFCARDATPRMQAQWRYTKRLLLELAAITRRHGIRLAIAVIPTIYQADPDLWKNYVSTFHVDNTRYDMEKPQRMLAEFCAQRHIPCVDLLEAMRKQSAAHPLFYRIDGHLNAEGHRVAAHVLTEYFTKTSYWESPPRYSMNAEGHPVSKR